MVSLFLLWHYSNFSQQGPSQKSPLACLSILCHIIWVAFNDLHLTFSNFEPAALFYLLQLIVFCPFCLCADVIFVTLPFGMFRLSNFSSKWSLFVLIIVSIHKIIGMSYFCMHFQTCYFNHNLVVVLILNIFHIYVNNNNYVSQFLSSSKRRDFWDGPKYIMILELTWSSWSAAI